MGSCKLQQVVDSGWIVYTCDQVRSKYEDILSVWRKTNGTEEFWKMGIEDKFYKSFKQSLDEFLAQCQCQKPEEEKVKMKCDKCSEQEHEGNFCRCEERNIKLAKLMRRHLSL